MPTAVCEHGHQVRYSNKRGAGLVDRRCPHPGCDGTLLGTSGKRGRRMAPCPGCGRRAEVGLRPVDHRWFGTWHTSSFIAGRSEDVRGPFEPGSLCSRCEWAHHAHEHADCRAEHAWPPVDHAPRPGCGPESGQRLTSSMVLPRF